MKRTVGILLSTVAFLSFALAQESQTQAPQVTALRVAHLAPNAQEVDVLVDGEVAFTGVGAGTVTGYRLLPAGDHQIELVPTGGVLAAPAGTGGLGVAPLPSDTGGIVEPAAPVAATPLVTATVTADAGAYYTLVATEAAMSGAETGGAEAGATGGDAGVAAPVALALTPFTDTFTNFPPSGQALVRVVHASPDAPKVNVVAALPETEQAADTGGADTGGVETGGAVPEGPQPIQGQNLATDLAFGSASEYAAVPAGTYHLQVQTTEGAVVLDLPDTLIDAGTVYTFYAFGSAVNGTLSANVSVDALIAREIE